MGEETATATPPTSTTPLTDAQVLKGPDQKFYKVKKSDMSKWEKSFTDKGWIRKDNKWFTQSGEEAHKLAPPNITPISAGADEKGRQRVELKTPQQISKYKGVASQMGEVFPTIGGMVGSMLAAPAGKGAQVAGAGIGGMLGEGTREIYRRIILDENIKNKDAVLNTMVEGVKQGGLEKLGQGMGELFFKMLSKIPHAEIKDGIKMLPSDLQPNGKVMKYIEDLLSNLAPSAKTMDTFKAEQSTAIIKKVDTLVDGMSRFKGTSEEIGMMVQKAMRDGDASGLKQLKAIREGYIKSGKTAAQADQYLTQTAAYKAFQRNYRNELAKKIITTNKPELIAGLFRADSTALEDARTFKSLIEETKPGLMEKVQNRTLRDILAETLTGSKDPIAKGVIQNRYSGNKFTGILNNIGEEKLKTIYGEEGYKRIEDFVKLTNTVGNQSQGSGVGKFLNLIFILPFKAGLKVEGLTKTGMTAFVLNRAAKVITSPEGMRIYENYIRAVGNNAPRALNLAKDELTKFNQRSDEEYQQDELEGEYEYEQSKKGKQ